TYICIYNIIVIFFFSSRRRHTRSKRDWSSDVCSSDLKVSEFLALVRESNLIIQYDLPKDSSNYFVKHYYTDNGFPINRSRVSLLEEKAKKRAVDDSFYIDRIPAFEKKVSEYIDALQSENMDV